jgi:octaprenyl-diphosphate synthase
MVAAEAFQLERRGRFEPDRDAYLTVVRGKTAALFRFALWAGGALGGLTPEQTQALADFGDALGMAFQVVDDLLDLRGDPAVMGKAACVDLREGKLTWPLLLAAERDPALARQMEAIATSPHLDVEAAARVVRAVHRMGVIAETVELAQSQAAQARAVLSRLPAGPVNAALATVIESVVQRSA